MSRRFIGAGAAALLLLGLLGCHASDQVPQGSPSPASTPVAPTPQVWAENSVHGPWRVVYTGYGSVVGDQSTIVLEPQAPAGPDVTHAALVAQNKAPTDLEAKAVMRTERQLRASGPNTWEVGWVLWRYRDDDHFYAVALKPNGWEVTKQDPAYPGSQRFLSTGSEPTFPVGLAHEVTIRQRGDTMTVSANGVHLTTFTDMERPYPDGGFALYTEDARVAFSDVRLTTLK